jgi:hypothetical protein
MNLSANVLSHVNITESRKAAVKYVTGLKFRKVFVDGLGVTSRKDLKSLISNGFLDGYLYGQGYFIKENNPLDKDPCVLFSRNSIPGFVVLPRKIGN